MSRRPWIVKLGGGAITAKREGIRQARESVIRAAAQQIRAAQQQGAPPLVVVHGAGPFGHKLVADYGIRHGVAGPHQVEGFVRTHNSMQDLNKLVMDRFRDAGLLGFPLQPSAWVVQREGRVEQLFLEPLERLLALDPAVIPILYGDMVLDRSLGASVVSGDTLVAQLARELRAERLLLGTDVAGIFSADPRLDPTARPIERIHRGNLQRVLQGVGESTAVDVTRGMRGKLEQLVQQVGQVPALIFDLTEPGALQRALCSQPVAGTLVTLG